MLIFKKRAIFISVCIITIFIVAFLIMRNLTKVISTEMLYAEAEKSAGRIIIHCSVLTSFDRYKGYEVNFDKGKAYIKAYYYAMPFLRNEGSGDFEITLNLTENKIEEVFLTDDEKRSVKIPIQLQ